MRQLSEISELNLADLHRRYYRWWTVRVWWQRPPNFVPSVGLKLGPLTLSAYYGALVTPDMPRWEVCVTWLGGVPWIDTGLARRRAERPHDNASSSRKDPV